MRKAHNQDLEATEEAKFTDPRSYVTHKGEIFLFGLDMSLQRIKVYERDHGVCQICKMWVSLEDMELDHYPKSRGRGGDDSMGNLRTLHSYCHKRTHIQPMWTKP
jgi:5-methylcytosine-specific restriction endonuclease McrA